MSDPGDIDTTSATYDYRESHKLPAELAPDTTDRIAELRKQIAKLVTPEMGYLYLIDECGQPGDAEERYHAHHDGREEYRQLLIAKIVQLITHHTDSVIEAVLAEKPLTTVDGPINVWKERIERFKSTIKENTK